jgi:uncharacterized repeat protein (TIGR03803 family)
LTVMHSFAGPTFGGAFPLASVTQDAAGNLYGTTERGGSLNQGTAWRITSSGQFSLLHGFIGTIVDGYSPYTTLIPYNGQLYGITFSDASTRVGALFKLDVGDGTNLPIEISVAPSTIPFGATTLLTWSSPSAVRCVAGGAWSDTVETSGSRVLTPPFPAIYSYALTCTDATGVVRSAYASLRVEAPPQEPVDGGGTEGGGGITLPMLLLLGGALLGKLRRQRE